jgi:hypothetical protein
MRFALVLSFLALGPFWVLAYGASPLQGLAAVVGAAVAAAVAFAWAAVRRERGS